METGRYRFLSFLIVGGALTFGAWYWLGIENPFKQANKTLSLEEKKPLEQTSSSAANPQVTTETSASPRKSPKFHIRRTKPRTRRKRLNNAQMQCYRKCVRQLNYSDFSAAKKRLANLVDQHPDDAELRYYYSKALFSSERPNKKAAVVQMKKAIELNPQFADAYYELGKMYSELKLPAPARRALLAHLKLAPGQKKAQEARRQLRLLRRNR